MPAAVQAASGDPRRCCVLAPAAAPPPGLRALRRPLAGLHVATRGSQGRRSTQHGAEAGAGGEQEATSRCCAATRSLLHSAEAAQAWEAPIRRATGAAAHLPPRRGRGALGRACCRRRDGDRRSSLGNDLPACAGMEIPVSSGGTGSLPTPCAARMPAVRLPAAPARRLPHILPPSRLPLGQRPRLHPGAAQLPRAGARARPVGLGPPTATPVRPPLVPAPRVLHQPVGPDGHGLLPLTATPVHTAVRWASTGTCEAAWPRFHVAADAKGGMGRGPTGRTSAVSAASIDHACMGWEVVGSSITPEARAVGRGCQRCPSLVRTARRRPARPCSVPVLPRAGGAVSPSRLHATTPPLRRAQHPAPPSAAALPPFICSSPRHAARRCTANAQTWETVWVDGGGGTSGNRGGHGVRRRMAGHEGTGRVQKATV